jgi:hypothetical protein
MIKKIMIEILSGEDEVSPIYETINETVYGIG